MVKNTTLKNGYKHTDIGIIPEDWKIKKIGDIFDITAGGDLDVKNFSSVKDEKYCYPIYSNALTNKGLYGYTSIYKQVENTITVTARGQVGVATPRDHKYSAIGRVLMLTPPNDINIIFISEYINYYIKFSNESTGVPQLTAPQISKYQISLPSFPEQSAIATILSDTNALIEHLETLIAKKKAIKEGTMQQLLTGKKRLPGFSGGWEVKKLVEVGEIITGSTPSTSLKKYWNGTIPWVTPTDISEKKDIYSSVREITTNGLQVIRKLPANTLLVTCIASIGKNAILRISGASNQQINAIIPNSNFDVDYLYYLMENSKKYLLGNAGITATLMISKKDFSEICFLLPKSKLEQSAIATILSDMDQEIESLEQKRNKYRDIKQGMMQELLIGNIRIYGNK